MIRSQNNSIHFTLTIIMLICTMVFTDEHFQIIQPRQSTISDNSDRRERMTQLQDSFVQWRDHRMKNYPETYLSLDRWFALNSYLPRDYLKINPPPEILQFPVPPIFDQSQFREMDSRSGYQEHAALPNYSVDKLERGRSDIDPTENDYGDLGYFYPRPQGPFALPKFTPLGGTSHKESATKAPTTVGDKEETTEIMTVIETTMIPPKSLFLMLYPNNSQFLERAAFDEWVRWTINGWSSNLGRDDFIMKIEKKGAKRTASFFKPFHRLRPNHETVSLPLHIVYELVDEGYT